MAKRKSVSRPAAKRSDPARLLRETLQERTVDELVDVIIEIAKSDRAILRDLEAKFEVVFPPKELIDATRSAIGDATDFDERHINHNFDYDDAAYAVVEKNLRRLVKEGHLTAAMELALELMKSGSGQVEMSDEGLMSEEIESCLKIVIEAVRKSDLSKAEIAAWCTAMLQNDRVGFICDAELKQLLNARK